MCAPATSGVLSSRQTNRPRTLRSAIVVSLDELIVERSGSVGDRAYSSTGGQRSTWPCSRLETTLRRTLPASCCERAARTPLTTQRPSTFGSPICGSLHVAANVDIDAHASRMFRADGALHPATMDPARQASMTHHPEASRKAPWRTALRWKRQRPAQPL